MQFRFTLLCIYLLLFFSCKKVHNKAPEIEVEKIAINIDENVSEIIRDQIGQYKHDSLLIIANDTIKTANRIADFFSNNNFKPVWTNRASLNTAGDSLMKMLDDIERYGLYTELYPIRSIKRNITNFYHQPDSTISVTRIYEVNILLTDVYFQLAVQLNKGIQDEKTFAVQLKQVTKDSAYVQLLNEGLASNRIIKSLESQEPHSESYHQLKFFLSKFLDRKNYLENNSTGPLTEDTSFMINGSFAGDTIAGIYNSFDSLKQKIEQLKINLERTKWEKEEEEDYSIFINIPSNKFQFSVCETPVLESRVITGKPKTQTPYYLNSAISHFFIYPYWNVPYSIATKEILPKLKKDVSYLEKENFDVLDLKNNVIDATKVKWKKYSEKYFPFRLRQRDGEENTLGVLKFMFSNPYGIYLHDTNSRSLFQKGNRWLSHGCIRLEKAKELADLICEYATPKFNRDSLNYYIEIKTRKEVNVTPKIPIHIRYYTAEAFGNQINFYPDIYNIDLLMQEALHLKNKSDIINE